MKIISYSDLHLEFGNDFKPPEDSDADLMILAGDIITFTPRGFEELKEFLKDWKKPVLFVAGNHEYYTKRCMQKCSQNFAEFAEKNLSKFVWLNNSCFQHNDVKFFGGTMWTNFNNDLLAMMHAERQMNDYHLIRRYQSYKLRPEDTVAIHREYKRKLIIWLEANKGEKRVVISHHAPCLNPNSNHKGSILQPAYNSLDMLEIIEYHQPEFWIYGHTHECDDQKIGKTRIISNQFGYYQQQECPDFDKAGIPFII